MSRHSIFVGVDGYSMHSELMSCPEHTDRDFLPLKFRPAMQEQDEIELTPRFATSIFVNGPLCPAALRRIVWMECTGVPGALGDTANIGASRGGCRGPC
jgi:hypothetical protein